MEESSLIKTLIGIERENRLAEAPYVSCKKCFINTKTFNCNPV